MHECEFAEEVCAAQTGHVHVPETVALVLALAAVIVILRMKYR